MKGKLHKTEKGWFVSFPEQSIISVYNGSSITQDSVGMLPLHPYDVKQIEEDSQVFDNIEARIRAYPDVEFYDVEECPHYGGKHFDRDCSCKTGFIRYAKLKTIQHTISDNFLIGPEGAFEWEDDSISDEDIEKAAKEYDRNSVRYGAKNIFIDAVNWYREQLKRNNYEKIYKITNPIRLSMG